MMMKKKIFTRKALAKTLLYLFLPLCILGVFGDRAWPQEDMIQTEIDLDQILVTKEKDNKEKAVKNFREKIKKEGLDISFDQEQIMMINQSLKNMIEENQKMTVEIDVLKKEIGTLRGQTEIRGNRLNVITQQKDEYKKRLERLERQQAEYESKIQKLQTMLETKEKEFKETVVQIEEERQRQEQRDLANIQKILPQIKNKKSLQENRRTQMTLREKADRTIRKLEATAKKVARDMSELNIENEQLKKDAAKMHYNLGNIFFERGKFKDAAREYAKVAELLPFDPDVHYNLAFVSGEFLLDYETAREHYEQYLALKPNAEDEVLVREKILEAELELKTKIPAIIDVSGSMR